MTSEPCARPLDKTTPAAGSAWSPNRRRMIRTCSEPNAVPHVATAFVTPATCAAMTSVYPSTMTTRWSVTIDFFARSNPYSSCDFL